LRVVALKVGFEVGLSELRRCTAASAARKRRVIREGGAVGKIEPGEGLLESDQRERERSSTQSSPACMQVSKKPTSSARELFASGLRFAAVEQARPELVK